MDIPLSLTDDMTFNRVRKVKFWSFLKDVITEARKGENPVIFIVGKPQKGKSTTATIIVKQLKEELGWEFDPSLQVKNHVDEFLQALVDITNNILVLEEAQQELQRKDWASLRNKLFHSTFNAEGKQHNIYIIIMHKITDLSNENLGKVGWLLTQWDKGKVEVQTVTSRPNDLKGEIRLGIGSMITYSSDERDMHLWEEWQKIVDPLKDENAKANILRIKNKRLGIKDKKIEEEMPDWVKKFEREYL